MDQGSHADALAAATGTGDQHVSVFEIRIEGVEQNLTSRPIREGHAPIHESGAFQRQQTAQVACLVDVLPQAEFRPDSGDEFREEGSESGLETAEGLTFHEDVQLAADQLGVEVVGDTVQLLGGVGTKDEEEFDGEQVFLPTGQIPDQLLGLIVALLPGNVPFGFTQGEEVSGADAFQFGDGVFFVDLAHKKGVVDRIGNEVLVDGVFSEAGDGEDADMSTVVREMIVVDGDVGNQKICPEENTEGIRTRAEFHGRDGGVGVIRGQQIAPSQPVKLEVFVRGQFIQKVGDSMEESGFFQWGELFQIGGEQFVTVGRMPVDADDAVA